MLIKKENLPLVAMDFMNDTHMEDVDIINELFDLILKYEDNPVKENETLLNEKYDFWYNHTVEHFKAEEIKMQDLNFPPYPFHKGEHDKALAEMEYIFNNWKNTKDISILKSYFIDTLPLWLVNHIQSMDTVTAMFFSTGLSPCASMQ